MSGNDYTAYYEAQQSGGALNDIRVFRGGYQHGGGLGDILKGLFRSFFPVALKGLSKFAKATMDSKEKGMSLREAAKSAIGPTISKVVKHGAPAAAKFINTVAPTMFGPHPAPEEPTAQEVAPQAEVTEAQAGSGVLFAGVDGVPESAPGYIRAAYKRPAGRYPAAGRSKKRRTTGRIINF